MWKRTADITIRTMLLLSVASIGATPAAASIFPNVDLPGATRDGASLLGLPELAPILAQSVDHPHPARDAPRNDRHSTEQESRLNRPMTNRLVLDFASVRRECANYDAVYRIDCLRQGIKMIASSLPDNSEYREAKGILNKASSRLDSIAGAYADPTAPRLSAPKGVNPRFLKRRQYSAVRREAVTEAMAKAQSVVTEASTALLRSGENSNRRYAHYQEISTAVDSTKVLLRSL